MTCYRFCSGMEFVFMAIIVSSFLGISMETNALEQSSSVFHGPKSIHFLIDMLNMHSDLIHMEIVKIDSLEPQCVVIIDSVKNFLALRDFRQKYKYLAWMKVDLRAHHFSWFKFQKETSFRFDRPVIFTHEFIKHQRLDLCNSAAFKAPRTQNGESVCWRHNNYLQTSLEHLISAKNVSVINRNTRKAEPFMSIDVRKNRKRMETFHGPRSIHFLIDMLMMHSDLIHMEIVKIDSSEPQCVVIIESVKNFIALRDFKQKYKRMSKMKDGLSLHHFSWFEFTNTSFRIDRPVIFTHELIKHQPRDLCNSAAFKAPRALNAESVRWSHNTYLPASLDNLISAKDVFVINRSTGKAEPFMSFNVLNKKRKRMQTSALEESSNVFHGPQPIRFLIDMLNVHSDLIHMEIVKIESSEPQCVVIIDSVKNFMALIDFKFHYGNMAALKDRLRSHHFSWFEFTRETNVHVDRPVIFTHEFVNHQPRDLCNSAAFKAPRTLNGESVPWRQNNYLQTSLEHVISAKDVSVINPNTRKADPFTSFPVFTERQTTNLEKRQKASLNEDSSSIPDLNLLPKEWDPSWSN